MRQRERLTQAITTVAWGYIFLHFNINLGPVDMLPGFVGMLLIYQSLPALGQEEASAALLRPLAVFLIISELLIWLANLLGITYNAGILSTLNYAIGLYFHFQLLTNLARIAEEFGYPEEKTEHLLWTRTGRTVLGTLTVFLPQLMRFELLMMAIVISTLVLCVVLCVQLFGLSRYLKDAPESLFKNETPKPEYRG